MGIRRKLVVVGNSGCGKTSLLTVFSGQTFPGGLVPSVFESYVADEEVDGQHVELALWDTAVQEECYCLSYSSSHVILVCFAIDSPDSLGNVQAKWISDARKFCPDCPVLLVGCKKDLRSDPRVIEELRRTNRGPVAPEEGVIVAQKIGARNYLECSARTGEGVREVFQHATRASLLAQTKKKSHSSCLVI